MSTANIKLLVLDVDGVLTDGTFVPSAEGDWKAFHVHDGLGIRLLQEANVEVALLSGRRSKIVEARAAELGIRYVLSSKTDKLGPLRGLVTQLGVPAADTAYMGDDLHDLRPLFWVGFSAAPADARPEIREAVDWVASAPGGHGAVRELCELLLQDKGLWEEARRRFTE